MRRIIILLPLLLLFVVSRPAAAQQSSPDTGATIAHGAAEQTRETMEPSHSKHGKAERESYFGIPIWIWKIANMLLFLGVLGYVLRKPLMATFDQRGAQIRADLAAAVERRARADKFSADVEARLKNLENEVAAILDRAREEGARQRDQLIAAAEEDAKKILSTARNEIDVRLKMARKELTEYAGGLAASRARQIVSATITDQDR
ncbi:MAG: ATP synthase F0 subunit B, partial [Acidobacteriota bacterium]